MIEVKKGFCRLKGHHLPFLKGASKPIRFTLEAMLISPGTMGRFGLMKLDGHMFGRYEENPREQFRTYMKDDPPL